MTKHAQSQDEDRDLVQLRHDVRQYVAAGVLLTRLPGDEQLDPETQERLQRLNGLFERLRELASCPDPAERAWSVDLVELVAECAAYVRLTRRVALDVLADGPTLAYGDPVMLKRAVTNVLDNAGRAAGTSGHVTVRVDSRCNGAVVEITDDGAGFGQIPTVTGQGLSIVDKALRACHGRLEISSGPGPGTTVRLLIPAQREAGGQA